jgi:peptidoglycan/xylan/chitin deacetylase (PgdA/CDA1 family)
MNNRSHPPARRTSGLLIVLLALGAGMTLGWLLRAAFQQPADQIAVPPLAPTAIGRAPGTTPLPTTPALPTATPIPAPTDTPQPTREPMEPTTAPATSAPAPVPTDAQVPEVIAYAGHVVAAGETLETIAANGGSTPDLIARYNRLAGPPQPGRALIVPQLADQTSVLENEPILVERGSTTQPWVALTLDAGASAAPVPRMLETLREHNVKITFFLTGKWIAENPDLARQIVADGHEIANHTFNHPDLTKLGDDAIREELAATEELIQQTTGATTRPFFRPPFGAYNRRVLQIAASEGYLPIYWTLDSLDSVGEPKTPEFLLERITGKLTPDELRGAIILAHCGSKPTADALPQILDRFAAMGFAVRKVSEVLGGEAAPQDRAGS